VSLLSLDFLWTPAVGWDSYSVLEDWIGTSHHRLRILHLHCRSVRRRSHHHHRLWSVGVVRWPHHLGLLDCIGGSYWVWGCYDYRGPAEAHRPSHAVYGLGCGKAVVIIPSTLVVIGASTIDGASSCSTGSRSLVLFSLHALGTTAHAADDTQPYTHPERISEISSMISFQLSMKLVQLSIKSVQFSGNQFSCHWNRFSSQEISSAVSGIYLVVN